MIYLSFLCESNILVTVLGILCEHYQCLLKSFVMFCDGSMMGLQGLYKGSAMVLQGAHNGYAMVIQNHKSLMRDLSEICERFMRGL